MEFHMINITYVALHMREQTEKTTSSCKDEAHKALDMDIFRFAVFFKLEIFLCDFLLPLLILLTDNLLFCFKEL